MSETDRASLSVEMPMSKSDKMRCRIHPDRDNDAIVKFYLEGSGTTNVYLCRACVVKLAQEAVLFLE